MFARYVRAKKNESARDEIVSQIIQLAQEENRKCVLKLEQITKQAREGFWDDSC
jgi:flagellar motor component MotA